MNRRHRSSTLFPYTTLFRSAVLRAGEDERLRHVVALEECQQQRALQVLRDGVHGVRDPDRDRKSTRLNSSHRTISYAVFCLKKKSDHDPEDRLGEEAAREAG